MTFPDRTGLHVQLGDADVLVELADEARPVALTDVEVRTAPSSRSGPRWQEWWRGRGVAHRLLKTVTCSQAGADPAVRLEVVTGPNGAPRVLGASPALHLSLTHSRTYIAAACGSRPLGVDVVDDRDGSRIQRLSPRIFDEHEQQLAARGPRQAATVFALKEAALKSRGGGVFDPGLRQVAVVELDPPTLGAGWGDAHLHPLPAGVIAVVHGLGTARA